MGLGSQVGRDLLNVPMGDMIRQMAFAIADAQVELDEAAMRVAEMMSGRAVQRDENGDPVLGAGGAVTYLDTRVQFGLKEGTTDPAWVSMLELGFAPTFYQFVDTIIEVKMAIKMTYDSSYTRRQKDYNSTRSWSNTSKGGGIVKFFGGKSTKSKKYNVTSSTVDATYSSKYGYSAEGASLLRTKLQPVPPPAILEERIRKLIEDREEDEAGE